uniref:Receptor expression-enhancing protein n=2 Tax=Scleropages formosus TaxID=113540 RepID=A0A8C9WTU3_SCLFO
MMLVFGTLYPAYYSYKAVKTKNVKEYVRWMMYWIVFALYTAVESVTDLSLSWFPLYYEIKIAFVIWLLSPYTRGASLIYRKFLHPLLSSKEREIDDYIVQAKERSYETMVNFGKQSLTIAATAAVSAAVKASAASTASWCSTFSRGANSFSSRDFCLRISQCQTTGFKENILFLIPLFIITPWLAYQGKYKQYSCISFH